jgi:serine/threonine protein kinase
MAGNVWELLTQYFAREKAQRKDMAKLYGGRWKIVDAPRLGSGGQSEVFRVVDTLGEYQGQFALKRVLNPSRHSRFRNEIEAVKRLTHPNIIELVDHSALDDSGERPEKQFLVMPIADGGDLGSDKRLSYYKDTVDGVLSVTKQIAAALEAAHTAQIVHRDIKPQNILFTGMGHETWLTDFGICLLRDQPRMTETAEIVGPRAFMAPELEDGGHLEVTPAADVYSLGKVIFYMISGGLVLPRERLDEEKYAKPLKRGERHRLLGILISKMVCPIERRIKTIKEVIGELGQIEEWDQRAQVVSFSRRGWEALERLKKSSVEFGRISDENTKARFSESARIDAVRQSFCDWIRIKLEQSAAAIQVGGALSAAVHELSEPIELRLTLLTSVASIAGFDLSIVRPAGYSGYSDNLRFVLCLSDMDTGLIQERGVAAPSPARDRLLVFFPHYAWVEERNPRRLCLQGFVQSKRSNLPRSKRTHVSPHFGRNVSLHTEFRASEWPAATTRLQETYNEAIESFFKFLNAGANMHSTGK